MSKRVFDCVGFGICALDYLCLIDKYPKLDEKTVLSDFTKQGGGPVPTALVTLARLGAQTAYIGKAGADIEGDFVQQELASEGVNIDFLVREDGSETPNAFIWIDRDSGKRGVVLNRTRITEVARNEIPVERLDAKVWLIDGWEVGGTLRIAKEAKRRGQIVVADFGSLRENIEKMLPLVNYPVVSENFVHQFFGKIEVADASQRLLRYGARAVVVTCGNKGSIATNATGTFLQPAFKVPVVDTTGAGDVFHGAFVFGILQDWPLPQTLRFASAVAALKCTGFGGRTAIPTLDATNKFLRLNPKTSDDSA